MKDVIQLKVDDLEKVTGGTGVDYEKDFKPMEDDLPCWWKQPTGNNNPTFNDNPFEYNNSSEEGTPNW